MRLPTAAEMHERIPDVNDGIVSVAGIIAGFIAAGAGDDALIAAPAAATIAGAVSVGGMTYGEYAAERDAEVAIIDAELASFARDPAAELGELTEHFVERGVQQDLAHEVALQMAAHDALAAQIETEHGILQRTPPAAPFVVAVAAAVAFSLGAALPILIIWVFPWWSQGIMTAIAVGVALLVTAALSARLGRARLGRTIVRSLVIGGLSLALSLLVGSALPDPDNGGRLLHWPAQESVVEDELDR